MSKEKVMKEITLSWVEAVAEERGPMQCCKLSKDRENSCKDMVDQIYTRMH